MTGCWAPGNGWSATAGPADHPQDRPLSLHLLRPAARVLNVLRERMDMEYAVAQIADFESAQFTFVMAEDFRRTGRVQDCDVFEDTADYPGLAADRGLSPAKAAAQRAAAGRGWGFGRDG